MTIGCRGICDRIDGLVVGKSGSYQGDNKTHNRLGNLIANRQIRRCNRCVKWMYVDKLVSKKRFKYYCPCCKLMTRNRVISKKSREILVTTFGMERKLIA